MGQAAHSKRLAVVAGLVLAIVAGLSPGSLAHHDEFVDKTNGGATERASVSSSGEEGNGESGGHECDPDGGWSISNNGRFVAFSSLAGNLHPADINGGTVADVFVRDRKTGDTELVSMATAGLAPDRPATPDLDLGLCAFKSFHPRISGNGRYVAFMSNLPLIGDGDTSVDPNTGVPFFKVYVHDLRKKSTELISQTWNGNPALGDSGSTVSISDSGRFVAFGSEATNMVEGVCSASDAGSCQHIYVRDRKNRETHLVSRSSAGEPGDGSSYFSAAISGDGRFVAFESLAGNLTAEPDINGPISGDVFVNDLKKGSTELISVSRDGTATGDFSSFGGVDISDDGRFVTFRSYAMNLVPTSLMTQGFSGGGMVYVRDRKTRRTERVNVTSTGTMTWSGYGAVAIGADGRSVLLSTQQNQLSDTRYPNDPSHHFDRTILFDRHTGQADTVATSRYWDSDQDAPRGAGLWQVGEMTGDARTIVGRSEADDVVGNDTNDAADVFVRDIGRRPLGSGFLATSGSDRAVTLPAGTRVGLDGVAILRDRPDDALVAGLGAEILHTRIAYRPALDDLYIRIEVDRLATGFSLFGRVDAPMLYGARLTIDGTIYELRAQRLGGDPRQGAGVFGLFDCTQTCTEVARLDGGYGTVGENVVVSVPLHLIGIDRGGEITNLEVFAGPGAFTSGLIDVLDLSTAR